jgi:hypothetical protein
MKINSINTTTAALALFLIAFAIMLIGMLVAIPPAGTTIIIQEAKHSSKNNKHEKHPQKLLKTCQIDLQKS